MIIHMNYPIKFIYIIKLIFYNILIIIYWISYVIYII